MSLSNLQLIIASSAFSIIVLASAGEAYLHHVLNEKKEEIAEIDLNRLTRKSSIPSRMWEYLPNQEISFNGISYKTDDYGYRNRINYPLEKQGKKRVAFVGDSVTLGFQTSVENTFIARYQNAFPQYEAINFGVDGYDIFQIRSVIENDILKFKPDEIIYTFCLNDFDNKFSSAMKGIIYGERLFYLPILIEGIIGNEVFEYHQFIFMRNKNRVFDEIISIKSIADNNEIDFKLVILPVFYQEDDNFSQYKLEQMHREIDRFLDSKQINYTDLLEDFRSSGKKPAFYSHDIWHPNDRGHKLIAKALIAEESLK